MDKIRQVLAEFARDGGLCVFPTAQAAAAWAQVLGKDNTTSWARLLCGDVPVATNVHRFLFALGEVQQAHASKADALPTLAPTGMACGQQRQALALASSLQQALRTQCPQGSEMDRVRQDYLQFLKKSGLADEAACDVQAVVCDRPVMLAWPQAMVMSSQYIQSHPGTKSVGDGMPHDPCVLYEVPEAISEARHALDAATALASQGKAVVVCAPTDEHLQEVEDAAAWMGIDLGSVGPDASSLGWANLLGKMANAYEHSLDMPSAKALLLDESLPWTDMQANRQLVAEGIDKGVRTGRTYAGKGNDQWAGRLSFAHRVRYMALRKAIVRLVRARSVSEASKALAESKMLDMQSQAVTDLMQVMLCAQQQVQACRMPGKQVPLSKLVRMLDDDSTKLPQPGQIYTCQWPRALFLPCDALVAVGMSYEDTEGLQDLVVATSAASWTSYAQKTSTATHCAPSWHVRMSLVRSLGTNAWQCKQEAQAANGTPPTTGAPAVKEGQRTTLQLSPTSVDLFIRCPRAWWDRHVLGDPDVQYDRQDVDHRLVGTLVHKAYERAYAHLGDEVPDQQRLTEVLYESYDGCVQEYVQGTAAADATTVAWLQTTLRSQFADLARNIPALRTLALEADVALDIPSLDIRLRGRIDRLAEDEQGNVVVIDYKKGHVASAGSFARALEEGRLESSQMAAYKLMLAPTHNVSQGLYYSLADTKATSAWADAQAAQGSCDVLMQVLASIRKAVDEDVFEPTPCADACRNCQCKATCDAYLRTGGAALRDAPDGQEMAG